MAIITTWTDGTNAPLTFTMPDDVVAAVDRFRQTVTTFDPGTGTWEPTYPNISALVAGMIVQQIIRPALMAFPTQEIAVAQAGLVTAQQTLLATQAAAIPDFVPAS